MSKFCLSAIILALGHSNALSLGALMPVAGIPLDPSIQMPAFVDNMLKMPPMDQESIEEITALIMDAQTKLNSIIPQPDQDKMRAALQDSIQEVSPQVRNDVEAQQQKVFDLLPEEIRKTVKTPEQFGENMEQILSSIPDENRIKIVNMMQSLAKENMDKELKSNPELLNRMKDKQDQIINALPADIKNEVRVTQDELSRKMQEIALRNSKKDSQGHKGNDKGNKANPAFSM